MDQNFPDNLTAADYNISFQIGDIVLGFSGIATNFLVMLVIFKTKQLHNKSQYVIFSHAFAEFLNALGNFARDVQEITNFVNRWPLAMSQYACFFLEARQVISTHWANTATMMLGIDRMLAVKFPIFYKQVNVVKYLVVFNLIPLVDGLKSLIWGPFLTLPYATGTVARCTYFTAYGPLHLVFNTVLHDVVCAITIAVYVVALAIVGYKYWGTKWLNEAQKSEWAKRIQLKAFKTIIIVSSIYLFCWAPSVSASLVGQAINMSPYAIRLQANLANSLKNCSTVSHFFVYLLSNPKFKAGFKKLFLREKPTVVSSFQINSNSKNTPRGNPGGGGTSGF